MKKSTVFSALAFSLTVLLLSACHFSVGTKKDLTTGLTVSYNGFSIEDVYMINAKGKRLNSNKIPMDSTFSIAATGVSGYTSKDGKAYPGCELIVKDKTGKVIGDLPDLLAAQAKDGLPPAIANTLSASLTLHPPFVRGETYHVTARFFDKQNPKNELTANVDVVLQ